MAAAFPTAARLLGALALACMAVRPASSFVTGPAAPRIACFRLGLACSRPLRARWTLTPIALRMAGDGPSSGDTRTEALLDVISEPTAESGGAEDDADGEEGSFRKRRAEKRRKAAGGPVSSELRFKLLEEQASPFRRFRQFFYSAAAGSASIGTFIAGTRVIAGLKGISGVQPLEETIPNTAINAGVVVVAGALWYFDEKRGQESLSELKGKSSTRLALDGLTVQDRDGDTRELLALRDDLRLVVLAGGCMCEDGERTRQRGGRDRRCSARGGENRAVFEATDTGHLMCGRLAGRHRSRGNTRHQPGGAAGRRSGAMPDGSGALFHRPRRRLCRVGCDEEQQVTCAKFHVSRAAWARARSVHVWRARCVSR